MTDTAAALTSLANTATAAAASDRVANIVCNAAYETICEATGMAGNGEAGRALAMLQGLVCRVDYLLTDRQYDNISNETQRWLMHVDGTLHNAIANFARLA